MTCAAAAWFGQPGIVVSGIVFVLDTEGELIGEHGITEE
jgi:hypothetical protein